MTQPAKKYCKSTVRIRATIDQEVILRCERARDHKEKSHRVHLSVDKGQSWSVTWEDK